MKRLRGSGEMSRGRYATCTKVFFRSAVYQAKSSNVNGTLRLLASAVELLSPFAPECMGGDVDDLLRSAGRLRERLTESALDSNLSPRTIPGIRFIQ